MTDRTATAGRARWEHVDHGADIGVRGFGGTKAEAFAQAAVAMTGAITDPHLVSPTNSVTVSCAAPDDDLLLLDWLNALILEMATRRMLFSRFDVDIADHRLSATAWGEPVDPGRHRPAVEVKGATLTALSVDLDGNVWRAQCVVDV